MFLLIESKTKDKMKNNKKKKEEKPKQNKNEKYFTKKQYTISDGGMTGGTILYFISKDQQTSFLLLGLVYHLL